MLTFAYTSNIFNVTIQSVIIFFYAISSTIYNTVLLLVLLQLNSYDVFWNTMSTSVVMSTRPDEHEKGI